MFSGDYFYSLLKTYEISIHATSFAPS